MKRPDIPQNEKARIDVLRALDVLDTPPEERFDRLTRMAKRMFGVPIALVSLIDANRQWFKSCPGLETRETSRDISFCGHAILGNEVFVVTDALEDPRFADNPLVLNEPHIRFYAGCPLTVKGQKLGTLCLLGPAPRVFDNDDIDALTDLAFIAERELAAVQVATLDELTNISNRRGFMSLAQQALSRCVRHHMPATLIFLDLDKFKPINDEFGHAEGDRALLGFASQMASSFRDSDLFARLGGDEFVVLLTNTSRQDAEDSIERFCDAIERYNRAANRGYDIAFSHGVVEFDPEQDDTVQNLLARGDALMYEAKRARRSR